MVLRAGDWNLQIEVEEKNSIRKRKRHTLLESQRNYTVKEGCSHNLFEEKHSKNILFEG
jgi:hypothetical protein